MSTEAIHPDVTVPAAASGVIHDIGYRRYDGPRLGRGYAARSLYTHGVRAAFGFGRTAKAKVFPWIVVGIVGLVAAVLTAIRAQTGQVPLSYWTFPNQLWLMIALFCAVVGPELVSRDLRSGVLPLYFSRPLTRTDYALTKFAALATACFLLVAGPQVLMFAGGAFSVDGLGAVWDEFVDLTKGLSASALYAAAFAALSILMSSLAGRRAVAAVLVVAVFLVTTPVYGVIIGIAFGTSPEGVPTGDAIRTMQLAGLATPATLVGGVVQWWYPTAVDPARPEAAAFTVGPYGPLFGAVTLGLVVSCLLLLLLRYRRVAR